MPGLAVQVTRRATRGGEHKSDPRDARVIADLVRSRDDLRRVSVDSQNNALGLLVSRRHDLSTNRPATSTVCSTCCARSTPAWSGSSTRATRSIWRCSHATSPRPRSAAPAGPASWPTWAHRPSQRSRDGPPGHRRLGRRDRAARVTVPGEDDRRGHREGHRHRPSPARASAADSQIAELLAEHPDAALIQSLPGMGAILTAEFLAVAGGITRYPSGDQLASAAGLAPGPAAVRQGPLPAALHRRRPHPQARLLPGRVLRTPTRSGQPAPTTTANAPRARPTTKPSSPWPADASTSCTPSCAPGNPTTTPTPLTAA